GDAIPARVWDFPAYAPGERGNGIGLAEHEAPPIGGGTTERNERYSHEETKTASPCHTLNPYGTRERSVRPGTSRVQPGLHLRQALLHRQQPRDLRSELAALPVVAPAGRPGVGAPTQSCQFSTSQYQGF